MIDIESPQGMKKFTLHNTITVEVKNLDDDIKLVRLGYSDEILE